ncbi:YodC family protein [Vibrio splendidus]|uniref:YodC family protein n=1 Tax=Vibrio splendidus TaxID=29497 RepID=UPI002236134D|nr:YodC family protein [Vibrio splendidus]MCW4438741.1 YodC family protein [Vibrio splendidus]
MSFEVGDIVKLKSGGPDMAINIFNQYKGGYKCQWFAGKKLEEGYFPADSLELVEKDN